MTRKGFKDGFGCVVWVGMIGCVFPALRLNVTSVFALMMVVGSVFICGEVDACSRKSLEEMEVEREKELEYDGLIEELGRLNADLGQVGIRSGGVVDGALCMERGNWEQEMKSADNGIASATEHIERMVKLLKDRPNADVDWIGRLVESKELAINQLKEMKEKREALILKTVVYDSEYVEIRQELVEKKKKLLLRIRELEKELGVIVGVHPNNHTLRLGPRHYVRGPLMRC